MYGDSSLIYCLQRKPGSQNLAEGSCLHWQNPEIKTGSVHDRVILIIEQKIHKIFSSLKHRPHNRCFFLQGTWGKLLLMLLHCIANGGIQIWCLAQPRWQMFAPLPLALPGVCWKARCVSVPVAQAEAVAPPGHCEAEAVHSPLHQSPLQGWGSGQPDVPVSLPVPLGSSGWRTRVWSASKDTFQPSPGFVLRSRGWRTLTVLVHRKQAGRPAGFGWCSHNSAWGGI